MLTDNAYYAPQRFVDSNDNTGAIIEGDWLKSTGTVVMLMRSERSLKDISIARKVLYPGNWHMYETVETVTQKHFIRVKLTIKFLNSSTI